VPFNARNAVLQTLASEAGRISSDSGLPAGTYTVRAQLRTVNEGDPGNRFDGSAEVEACVDGPGAYPRRSVTVAATYNGERFVLNPQGDPGACLNIDDSSPATVLTRIVNR
jgi:hypothetical protein